MSMNNRELWQQINHYGDFDRMPAFWICGWPETHERWLKEGVPGEVLGDWTKMNQYLNATGWHETLGWTVGLFPEFDIEIREETDEYRIYTDKEGVVSQEWKHKSSIPHYIDFTFKDASNWPEYKRRLQPDPRRLPADLEQRIAHAETLGVPLRLDLGSMMGWTRNWMGVENMSYLMYDDQDCYADIVMTIADLMCWGMDQIVPKMKTKPDIGFAWEDICGKTGPMISPDLFRKCVAPGYLKMRNKLESYGCKIMGLDTDGYFEPLIKDWMDCGVNYFFPVERGTWNARAADLRRKFGKELRMIGNFDKHTLELGRAEIDAEFENHVELMKEGGYVIFPDHLIPPGTPFENYRYFIEKVRAWRR